MAVGNRLLTIIGRATVVMLIAWAVGTVIGTVAQRTVDQHIEDFRKANPIPEAEPVTDTEADSPADASSVQMSDQADAHSPTSADNVPATEAVKPAPQAAA